MGVTSRSRGGIIDRFRTGWSLTTDSISVIRRQPELLVFPLVAGLSSLLFFIVFLGPLVIAEFFGETATLLVLFGLYFATTFVSTYCTAALVHATATVFRGEDPSVVGSLKAVGNRVGPIAVWSVIAATVSVILRSLEDSDNPIAGLLSVLFSIGWSILTFFIVPVIVFEDVTVRSMFERSGTTFRETWGETLGAGFGVTLIVGLIGLGLVLLALALATPVTALAPGAGIGLGVVLVVFAITIAYLLSQTVWGIIKTALYLYATDGQAPAAFDDFDFETLDGRVPDT